MENRPDSLENKSLAPYKRKPLSAKSGTFALLLSTLWSANPVATKAGLLDSGPLRYGYLRFALGGITNLIWALITKKSFKIKPSWTSAILIAIALAFGSSRLGIPQAFIYFTQLVIRRS